MKHAQVFDCLPAAALVAGDIFCVHGGLSPKLTRPADVGGIKRPCRLLAERGDLLSDLTWSDPSSKTKGALCWAPARRWRRAVICSSTRMIGGSTRCSPEQRRKAAHGRYIHLLGVFHDPHASTNTRRVS